MLSTQPKKTAVNYVTEPVFKREVKSLREEIRESIAEAIKGMQVMFDEQDARNDAQFATLTELREFKEEFREFKHANLSMMDALMTELKAIREELAVGGYRQRHHTDRLDNHEVRITTVEQKLDLV